MTWRCGDEEAGLDAVSFVFGAVFLTFVVVWLGARLIEVELASVGWFVAGALILFGVIGVWDVYAPTPTEGQIQREMRRLNGR